ncbi:MAG: CAP domain-containing protein [Actinomycetota bacterium]|nr:CAP domain-containing protein [Actinomycetota bacterium]
MARMLDIRIAGAIAALVAAALLALGLNGVNADRATAAAQGCPKADATPGEASTEQLGDSVLCLIGKERRRAGVKQVEEVRSLERVAEKHTDVMIKKDCLQHRCDGERSLNDRIVRSGYPIAGGRYAFAEVTGCSRTPQAMVDAWMDKRVFRKRILGRPYRDVGVGAGKGKPDVRGCNDGRPRGVYTVIFAWRNR